MKEPNHTMRSPRFLVERDMGVEVKHVYGLMGTRGGGTGRILMRDGPGYRHATSLAS